MPMDMCTAAARGRVDRINALIAEDDELATAESATPWEQRTTAQFDLTVFTGDHFYINTNLPELSHWVEERILR